jgi:hypothetical protein
MRIWEMASAGIPWSALRTSHGRGDVLESRMRALRGADLIPRGFLDNVIVVQGQLFEAAPFVVPVLVMRLVAGGLSAEARFWIIDVLTELALGHDHFEEPTFGEDVIADACKTELRKGLWVFYSLLDDSDERNVKALLYILEALEDDLLRLKDVLVRLKAEMMSSMVMQAIDEVVSDIEARLL